MTQKTNQTLTPTIESFIPSHDHHQLYYQAHLAENPRAVLIMVHGLGEHSGRYENLIRHFVPRRYSIYLFDHRGHGKSHGLRSFVDSFDAYLKDLHEFTLFVLKQERKKKIFMVGHSMGGQIVLNYIGRYNPALSGFMTSSANIRVAMQISWLKKTVGMCLARLAPQLAMPNEIDPKWISRDGEVVRAYKKDPLVCKNITLRLVSEILNNQKTIMNMASQIHLPAFIMHAGEDHLCAKEGSQEFFKKLASKDKALKIYEGFYHEIFNEIGKEQVFKDMEEWLHRHNSSL